MSSIFLTYITVLLSAQPGNKPQQSGILYDSDVMMNAMVAEMDRSMEKLEIKGLARPYLIRMNAEERLSYVMRAAYGAIVRSEVSHQREGQSRVRVGSYELDNTNMGFGWGGRTRLPLEDDTTAIRHAMWQMLDQDYKRAVEVLTRKQTYLQQKNVVDRPNDYAAGEGEVSIEPSPESLLDRDAWEEKLRRISRRFADHPDINDGRVSLVGGAVNQWIADTEGARIRMGDTGVILSITAELQAQEGMLLKDSITYIEEQPDLLPPIDAILDDIDTLCRRLNDLSSAPVLDEYTGPVLFDAKSAGRVFETLLADKLSARPIPLGRGGAGDPSLARKIGRRILPRTFQAYDDPSGSRYQGKVLAGSYRFDDEGIRPRKVVLVENGILKTLVSGRSPTKKIQQTTGHARKTTFSDPVARIGCLYVEDTAGLPDDALKAALIQAAKDEGLSYGLRVESLRESSGGMLGDPIFMYKVNVEDGSEELVRGMEFGPIDTRELKRMLAAGDSREVYNSISGAGSSIICPSILVEEVELTRIEKEFDRLPILASPATRTVAVDK
ncbi:MAG: metallopeptidase TldD-related protein [Planctomycetota bacterium]|jgi:hypothetical protein